MANINLGNTPKTNNQIRNPLIDLEKILGNVNYSNVGVNSAAQSLINTLANQRRIAEIATLKNKYDQKYSGYQNQMKNLDNDYTKSTSTQDKSYLQNAKRLREIMAHNGLATGQKNSANAQLVASNQNAMSNLSMERQNAINSILTMISTLDSSIIQEAKDANSDIDNDRIKRLLSRMKK